MNNDKAKELRDYLREFLDRNKRQTELIPEIQRAYEVANWQYQTLTAVGSAAPTQIQQEINLRLGYALTQMKTHLPLPMDYTISLSAIANTVTGSTMSIYAAMTDRDLQEVGAIAQTYVTDYQILQQNHGRRVAVEKLIKENFPHLSSYFNAASNAFETAKSLADETPSAANEMRVVLDKLKGELFEKARSWPKENMTWKVMAERIGKIPDPTSGAQLIKDQEVHRDQLYSRLSQLLKKRDASNGNELANLWALLLDHLAVVLGSI